MTNQARTTAMINQLELVRIPAFSSTWTTVTPYKRSLRNVCRRLEAIIIKFEKEAKHV